MSIVPLGVEMEDASVLIVGGGAVGARKSRGFVGAGAHVVVLSPEFADHDFGGGVDIGSTTHSHGDSTGNNDDHSTGNNDDHSTGNNDDHSTGSVEFVRVEPDADQNDAADWIARIDPLLVVCATPDEAVNRAFAAAARDAGVLRNRADVAGSEDAGSVVVPATIEDEGVVVSVSTGGRSPALSAYLRSQIEDDIDGAGGMAALSGEIRAQLKDRGVPATVRRDAVRAVVNDAGVWKALRTVDSNARQAAETVVESVIGTQGST